MTMIGILCAWVEISATFASVKCTWLSIVSGQVLRVGQFLRWMLLWGNVVGVILVMWISRMQVSGVRKARASPWKVMLVVGLVWVMQEAGWYLFEGAFSAKFPPPQL